MRQVLMLLFFFFLPIFSYAASKEVIVIIPNCMLSQRLAIQQIFAQNENVSLIKVKDILLLQRVFNRVPNRCRGFMNVTTLWNEKKPRSSSEAKAFLAANIPKSRPSDFNRIYAITERDKVFNLFKSIDPQKITTNLLHLSSYPDRAVNSISGLQAAMWIKQQLDKMVEQSGRDDVMVKIIPTENGMAQPSILFKMGKHNHNPAVIMGAHLDTVAKTYENKPGADDDGSGTVSLLEAARVLLMSNYTFKKPFYFVWYSGEEAGKLGSQRVVAYMNQHNIAIDAVLHLDMTGYMGGKTEGIGIADDYTDAPLSAFIADLASAYLKLPVAASRCGYACSDHVTWYQNGNRVAYPFETMDDVGNPFVHTAEDRFEKLSITHIANFSKLTVAFAMELSGVKEP